MFAEKQIMEFEKHERKRLCLRCGEIMGQIQMTSWTSWGCRAGLRSPKAKFSGKAGLFCLLMVVAWLAELDQKIILQKLKMRSNFLNSKLHFIKNLL